MTHHIQIDLEITFAGGWRAGSGEGSFTTDRLVCRNTRNQPYLPASTLKGNIRQSCEKLSRTLGFPSPSDPHETSLVHNQAFVPLEHLQSPIDCIFGTKFEPGGLFFRDAHPRQMADTSIRHRTARWRVLKTVRDKHLFSTEYSPPALILSSRIEGWHRQLVCIDENWPPFAYCLLIAGILAVKRLGGDKSTGAGWLQGAIAITQARYNQMPLDLNDVLDFELLNHQDYQEMKGAS